MKVNGVYSSPFRADSCYMGTKTKITDPFLYTLDTGSKRKTQIKNNDVPWLTGALAIAAVMGTLYSLRGKNFVPESVVDIADKAFGLNRIKGYEKNISDLKSKVLYPIVATMKGDKSFLQNGLIKKGIIISSKNEVKEVKEVYDAFFQHAEKLGIKCIRMPMENPKKLDINCKYPQMKWERSSRIKWVYEAIEEAKTYYNKTNEYVIVFFGDLGKLTNMKIKKGTDSKIELLLKSIDREKYPGVVWAGWTDKQTAIPELYNNMPSFISKLSNSID